MDAVERFAALVEVPSAEVDLARAALAFAAVAEPGLDEGAALAELDRMAGGVHDFSSLRRRLFVEEGFTGVVEGYYRPENSLLHRVLDRRRGIPISLSVVVIEVGKRAGVPVQGVGLPGHFIIRDPASGRLCDPFHAGALVDELAPSSVAALEGGVLPIVDAHQILARMLANLANVFRRQRRLDDLELALRCQRAVPGAALQASSQLADLLSAGGRFVAAAEELEATAGGVDPAERDRLLAAAAALRARLN